VNTGGKSLQANGLSIVTLLLFFGIGNVAAEDVFTWPDGQKMAISLSYDDALDSQLDNAIPSLNKHGLVASFYLTLASPTVRHRLEEWRAAAVQGHELGNHTIFHPCSAALPDRDWVPSYYNLDDYVIQEIVDEVTVANSFLHAIDGRRERTLTAPCGDYLVSGENYLPEVRGLFVAVKGFESNDKTFANWWGAVGVSGSELIERIEIESASGTKLFNIIFHGIGGDYLTVTSEAHNYLLDYLVDKRETYWVDSYINIMKYASDNSAFEDVR
jgi:peptidoglycan/xylan/chitin deacetylase (PgdA/CDA1 family)